MKLRKVKAIAKSLLGIFSALMALMLLTYNAVFGYIAIAVMCLYGILVAAFWRCPKCRKNLGPLYVKYCPNCGEKLEFDLSDRPARPDDPELDDPNVAGVLMQRIKRLNNYQKGVIIAMVIMALIFAVIYPKTLARVGYRYHDAILVPQQEGGNTVYSGKIDGGQAQFIVSENKSVVLQYRDKTYGPYMIQENPTAIPKDEKFEDGIIGIEVFNGDKVLFRGGLVDYGDAYWLYNEDGTLYGFEFSYAPDYGLEVDQDGNEVDKMAPSAYTIYELLNQPKLTHKGDASAWFGAVFVCILNPLSILFADELFRWNLSFQIRNTEDAEPSDWEIAGRYMGWTVLAITALVIFITGLQ